MTLEQKYKKIINRIVELERIERKLRKELPAIVTALNAVERVYEKKRGQIDILGDEIRMLEDKAGDIEEEMHAISKEMEEVDDKWFGKASPKKRTGKSGGIKSKRGSR